MSDRIPCPDRHPRYDGQPITCGCAEYYIRGAVVRRRRPSRSRPPYVDGAMERAAEMRVTLTVDQIAGIIERALAGVEPPWIDLPERES